MGTAAPQISFEASPGGNHSFITNESLGQQLHKGGVNSTVIRIGIPKHFQVKNIFKSMELKKDMTLNRNRAYSGCSRVSLLKRHEGDEGEEAR